MKSRAVRFFVLASIGVVAGCTHRQSLGDGRALAGASVRFESLHGYEERGDVVETQGRVLIRGERGDFELDEVLKITEIRRLRGALEGGGWGVLIGGAAGAVFGYSRVRGNPNGDRFTAGEVAEFMLVPAALFGLPAGIIGVVVGTLRGSRDVYSGKPRSQTRFIPAGPAGSAVGATVRF